MTAHTQTQDVSAAFKKRAVDVHVVDAKKAGSYELLEAAYNGIFAKTFPEEAPFETLAKWHTRLEAADAPSKYIIGISGENLNDPATRIIKGMFVGIYYKSSNSGLLAYNIVAPEWQGTGLGAIQIHARRTLLLEAARENGCDLGGIFAECNDPSKISEAEDVMNPQKRIDMYAHMGGKRVPINYVCPIGADAKLTKMMLLAFPHPETGAYPTAMAINRFIRGAYEVRGLDADASHDFHRMNREVNKGFTRKRGLDGGWLYPLPGQQGFEKKHKYVLC